MKKRISVLLVIALWGAMFGNNLSASIFIGGAHIDSTKDTVVSNDNVSGIVRYEAATRTITLQDASIDMPSSATSQIGGIHLYDEDTVSISLLGSNTITGVVPIEISHSVCHILGTGTLVLDAPYENSWGGIFFWALYPWHESPNGLIISGGCHVEVRAPHSAGICTRRNPNYPDAQEDRCSILIAGSTLVVDAGGAAIWHARELSLSDSHIESPENAFFSADSGTVMGSDGLVSNYLRIRPGTSTTPEYDIVRYKVFGSANGIHLQEVPANTAVSIFNISGQLVQTLKITQSNMVVPVKSGIYIVKIGDYKRKVVVL